MTAAIVPALIESNSARRRPTAMPTLDIAGVRWPIHKAHALAVAVIVAVFALVITGSGQVTMWASAAALLTVWWGERACYAARATR